MKKVLLSALFAMMGFAMQAQTSSEAIISSCPTMPSNHDIAIYMVKGENAAVQKYYQQLGEACRVASKVAVQEYERKDFAKEQANMQKKQKQIMNSQASRMEAGKRMMKFLETLTPDQRKKFESFRKEADAFQYLASIGKLDELHDLMEGVPGAVGDESPVNQADSEMSKRDLTAELAAANEPIFEALEKMQKFDAGLREAAEEASNKSVQAHAEESGVGGAYDATAVENDLISFWEDKVATHKRLLLDCMNAIKASIPTARMYDKQQNATRRMTGQSPLAAMESNEYGKAMEYLDAAKHLLPGNDHGSEIQEMMEDKTQEINYNK